MPVVDSGLTSANRL